LHGAAVRAPHGVLSVRPRIGAARDHWQMLREPDSHDLFHAPPEYLCVGARTDLVDLPLGGRVRPRSLRAFVAAMAEWGQPVQAARLGYDRRYAFERLARAHTSDDAALRALAVELFAAFADGTSSAT
jgi:hypothetical protein